MEQYKQKALEQFKELQTEFQKHTNKSLKELSQIKPFNYNQNLADDLFDFNYKNLTATILVNESGKCELSSNVEYWLEENMSDARMIEFSL